MVSLGLWCVEGLGLACPGPELPGLATTSLVSTATLAGHGWASTAPPPGSGRGSWGRGLPDGRAQFVGGSQGFEDAVGLRPPLPGEGAGEAFGKGPGQALRGRARRSEDRAGLYPALTSVPAALPDITCISRPRVDLRGPVAAGAAVGAAEGTGCERRRGLLPHPAPGSSPRSPALPASLLPPPRRPQQPPQVPERRRRRPPQHPSRPP